MKYYFVFLICPVFFQSSCYDNCAFSIYQIPYPLVLSIRENGVRASDEVLDNVKLSYFEMGNKFFIKDFQRGSNDGPYKYYDLGLMGSIDIGIVSGEQNIKTYFLEYNDGDIDTLLVNYKYLSASEACDDQCKCLYPLQEIKFNNKNPPIDSSVLTERAYILNRN